jgi:hypothetical protein
MINPNRFRKTASGLALLAAALTTQLEAGTLTGSFTSVAAGTEINLTTLGKLDWVQWGLNGDYAMNRKAGVTPRISNFTLLTPFGTTFSSPYWLVDTSTGFSAWSDGHPVVNVTSNHTRVMAYSYPVNAGNGFRITVPADTSTNVLSVYVGTLSARGVFKATLPGQTTYTNSQISTDLKGVYTITFAADSPGQTLTVEWTLSPTAFSGNVTLQAAALTAPGANNPPFALLTNPANDSTFVAPASITFNAFAEDYDGTVTNVAFYANSNFLGQDSTHPYAFTWNNAPAGHYHVTAVATDSGGGSRPSVPIEVFVHGTNGSQAGMVEFPEATVDLTAEGPADWVHWGLETNTSVNRKSGVPVQVSDFTLIGSANVSRYSDNYTGYGWSDGTPIAATNGTTTGVFLTNLGSGFELTVPADTTPRVLRLYVGAYAARARMLAQLSDFSAQPYIDKSIYDTNWNSDHAVFTIAYRAAAAGQQLKVVYHSQELLDGVWGNVTLQAATLSAGTVRLPVVLMNPVRTATDFMFSFATQSDCAYAVEAAGTLAPPGWTNVTTVPGTGGSITITNQNVPPGQQFYRVITQ